MGRTKAPTGDQAEMFQPADVPTGGPIRKTLQEVADYFGMKWRQIANWKKSGMPVEPDGTYNIHDIDDWTRREGLGRHRTNKPRSAGNGKAESAPPAEGENPFDDILGDDGLHVRDYYERKKLKVEIKRKEFDLAVKKGEYLERVKVQAQISHLVATAKNRLLGLSTSVAPRLFGKEIPEIQHTLDTELRQILATLSSAEEEGVLRHDAADMGSETPLRVGSDPSPSGKEEGEEHE